MQLDSSQTPISIGSAKEDDDNRGVGIACRLDSPKALEIVQKISDFLMDHDERIFYETRIAPKFIRHYGKNLGDMTTDNTKFLISVGGDGTVLRICQALPKKKTPPLLGVNLGSVGFLDESESENLLSDLSNVLSGNYQLERVSRLRTIIGKHVLPEALNEVLIISSKPSKVLYTRIEIDDAYFTSSYLDGLIISTHTGSTAYALSAGGCLMDPRVKAFEVVPLNPFVGTGVFRPLLIPEDAKVSVILERARLNGLVIIDGQSKYRVNPEVKITIRKAKSDIYFVRLNKNKVNGFYERVRKKILFSRKIVDDSPED